MLKDVNTRRGDVSNDLLARVDRFQSNAGTLGLSRYAVGTHLQIDPASTRDIAQRTLFQDLLRRLDVGSIAHIRLGAIGASAGDNELGGHTLLLQRLPDENYVIFDPNNGAFVYPNRNAMRDCLTDYIDSAFEGTGLHLRPDSVQYYTRRPPATIPAMAPPAVPLRDPIPSIPRGRSETRDAYRKSADIWNDLSQQALSAASARALSPVVGRGLAMQALTEVAQRRSPTLTQATENIRQRLSDRVHKPWLLQEIDELQRQNQHGLVGALPNYLRHEGVMNLHSAGALVGELQYAFDHPQIGDDERFGYHTEFAVLDLRFRDTLSDTASAAVPRLSPDDGHTVIVQRLRSSSDSRTSQYELYDPDAGVFRYANFAELATALHGMYEVGFLRHSGIDHVDTNYYVDLSNPVALAGADTSRAPLVSTRLANLTLSGVEHEMLDRGTTPHATPRPTLPTPPVVFDPPVLQAYKELKRQTGADPEGVPVDGVFRPSVVSPIDLQERGGFDTGQTPLREVNLSLHDHDVASSQTLIDSAGYLGTFRRERTALDRLPGDGYIYYIAPTPNMVDVNATLGRFAHVPRTEELAAMGWIDFSQIRGWRPVRHGVPGHYERNSAYRWDVYDRTSSAGAQPQLARVPISDFTWRDDAFASYVSADTTGDRSRKFKENPDLAHAFFYDAAWQKARDVQDQQNAGRDYRGPLRLQAYDKSDRSVTQIYLDASDNVYVNSMNLRSSTHGGTRHNFAVGDDGRFHVVGDYAKVLRVGSDGNLYAGNVPDDPESANGVFDYVGQTLIHREDGKYLTTGLSSYTPFVDSIDRGERSHWQLIRQDRTLAIPPEVNRHTFTDDYIGSRAQQYAFYRDPDSALPRSATHFVTTVPQGAASSEFREYVKTFDAAGIRDAAAWLYANNAAWLFRDGFYAVSNTPGKLDVFTLGGSLAWHCEGLDSDLNNAVYTHFDAPASTYRMRDDIWGLVIERERRRKQLSLKLSALGRHM
ncbi:hypothetical protein PBS_21330 [Paraburkholderia sp. 2C]